MLDAAGCLVWIEVTCVRRRRESGGGVCDGGWWSYELLVYRELPWVPIVTSELTSTVNRISNVVPPPPLPRVSSS